MLKNTALVPALDLDVQTLVIVNNDHVVRACALVQLLHEILEFLKVLEGLGQGLHSQRVCHRLREDVVFLDFALCVGLLLAWNASGWLALGRRSGGLLNPIAQKLDFDLVVRLDGRSRNKRLLGAAVGNLGNFHVLRVGFHGEASSEGP